MATLRPQVGISYWRLVSISREAVQQPRVRPEPGWPTGKLARVAQYDSRPAVHGLNGSANLHILIAIAAQVAHFRAVVAEADDDESAAVVWRGGSAHVKEARAVGQLHHVVNVRRETNVLFRQAGGFIGRNARPRLLTKYQERLSFSTGAFSIVYSC